MAGELISGEIGDDLTSYFVLSDQVPTSVGVGVLVNGDTSVKQAGGFIIQLMPGYYDYLVDELEHNLAGVSSVTSLFEDGMTPADILQYLLRGLDYQELEVVPAQFHCGCNERRAARAVIALGKDELHDMIEKGEPARAHCHFCGKEYVLETSRLEELLAQASC
jgi:molecular chaperone Hsp33